VSAAFPVATAALARGDRSRSSSGRQSSKGFGTGDAAAQPAIKPVAMRALRKPGFIASSGQ